MHNFTTALVCFVTSFALACGGGNKKVTNPEPDKSADAGPAAATNDQTLDKFKEIALTGMRFAPSALGRPSLGLAVKPKRKISVAKQRKQFAKAKGKKKQTEAAKFATLLWSEARKHAAAKAMDKAKKAREEARNALAAAFKAGADKTKEYVLVMLANAELFLGNDTAAAAVYAEHIKRFPTSKRAMSSKTWLAYVQLRAGQNAEAAKTVTGWTAQAVGTNYLAAYVLAWTQWRGGDIASAHQSMTVAATNWKGNTGRQAMYIDNLLLMARGGISPADADKQLTTLAGTMNPSPRYGWMFKLSDAYLFAGNYKAAAETLELLASGAVAANVPPKDLVAFRFKQADYAFRLNDPAASAVAAIKAYEALAPCAAACASGDKEAVTMGLRQLASVYHTVFAASLDERYYEAAKSLYTKYIGITPPRPDKATITDYLSRLEQAKKNTDKSKAQHDQAVMQKLINVRREAIAACYEATLQTSAKLTGTVKLTVSVDSKGAVTGATTEPKKGKEGMAAVAGCMEQAARGWTFPSRTTDGTTTMSLPYTFSERAPAPAAAPTPAAKP